MIIEYTRGNADKEIKGFDFTAYRWTKHKDTLIIHNLWEIIVKNSDEDFDVLYNLLKFYQRNTTVKSKVDIYKDKDRIEITNKSIIFPNILIIKK